MLARCASRVIDVPATDQRSLEEPSEELVLDHGRGPCARDYHRDPEGDRGGMTETEDPGGCASLFGIPMGLMVIVVLVLLAA
jgi:hypothetical protein